MDVSVLAGLVSLAVVVPVSGWRLLGCRRLRFLADLPAPGPGEPLPRVSIIAPARNEARALPGAARGWRDLDYPDVTVTLVDDRSTDATGEIAAGLAREWPALRVLRVDELPPGWLGKNHANHLAAASATGEWLLFTDADVVLARDALARAVAHACRESLDHLVVGPEARMPGWLLGQFPVYFGLLYMTLTRPWAVRDPASSAHVGVGAFNLVRASAYRAVGGHERLRMRPDDDLKLGKLLKSEGYRQDFVVGTGKLTVEWYSSWRDLQTGLMKNLYAGVDYRPGLVLGGALANLVLLSWPLLAAALLEGTARWLYVALLAVVAAEAACLARYFGTSRWAGLAMPLYGLAGAWLMLRALVLTHLQGGIRWRGTFYPLDALRSNRL